MNISDVKNMWEHSASEQREFMLNEFKTSGEVWKKLLGNILPSFTLGEVLDVGCGTGFLSVLIAELGFHVTAVDSSAKMLEEARNVAKIKGVEQNINFIKSDAEEMIFSENQFVAVVLRHSSWLFEDPRLVYEKSYKYLSKGGVLINFDANWLLPLNNPEVKREFELDEKILIEKYGEFMDYYHNKEIMEVLNSLPLSFENRPSWDEKVLRTIGFSSTETKIKLSDNLWDEFSKIRYRQIPTFLINAKKL